MFSYRRLSENMGEGDEDWVDFPASPKPDRWGALLREANRLSQDVPAPPQGARHQIAHFAGRGVHGRPEPEAVTSKNG